MRRMTYVSALIATLAVTNALAAEASNSVARDPRTPTPLEVYRASAARLLENELVPRLVRGATSHGGTPRFAVRVIPARDPLRLEATQLPDRSVDLSVSAGFLLFADALVDAEVLGRRSDQRQQVERYFDELVSFPGAATRHGVNRHPELTGDSLACRLTHSVDGRAPPMFYQRLGWAKSLYDLTFVSSDLRRRAPRCAPRHSLG